MQPIDITIQIVGNTLRVTAGTDKGRMFLSGKDSTESYIDTLPVYEQLAKENKVNYVINR